MTLSLQRFSRIWDAIGVPLLLTVALSLVSAFRLLGLGRDFVGYTSMFQWARDLTNLTDVTTFTPHDLGFGFILFILAKIYRWSDGMLFFILSFPAIFIKLWCFSRFSPNFWISLLVYLSLFFVVPEYTQLRAASALALVFLATTFILVWRKPVAGTVIGLGAVSLHLSSALVLPFIIAASISINLLLLLASLSLFSGTLLEIVSIPMSELFYATRLSAQLAVGKAFPPPNPFSSLKIFEYFTLAMFFLYLPRIRMNGWVMVETAGWFLFVGLTFFFGLFAMPEFAHRISQLFSAFVPFLIAGLAMLMPRNVAMLYVGAIVGIGCWSSYRLLS